MELKHFLIPTPYPDLGGEYNGYVVLPKDHPFSKNIKEKAKTSKPFKLEGGETLLSAESVACEEFFNNETDVDVHGGITFYTPVDEILDSEYETAAEYKAFLKEKDRGGYVIGFDTCHGGDGPEWDHEAVKNETVRFKEQLEEYY